MEQVNLRVNGYSLVQIDFLIGNRFLGISFPMAINRFMKHLSISLVHLNKI